MFLETGIFTAAAVIPIYHVLEFIGVKIFDEQLHFHQYSAHEKDRLIEIFHSRQANVAVSAKSKKNLISKLEQATSLFDQYSSNVKKAMEQAGHPLDSKFSFANNTKPQQRSNESGRILERLINDMGKPPQHYSPSDIMNRFHIRRQKLNDALEEQFNSGLEQLNKMEVEQQVIDAFTKAHEEQKKAILAPMNEAVNAIHKTAKLQADQEFTAMQQWQILKYTKDNLNNEILASINCDADGTTLTMNNVNIENAAEKINDYNESKGLKGDDRVSFNAKNGQRLNIVKNANGFYDLEFDLPRRILNPFYYCSPYSNIKSSTQDAIAIHIASGHIAEGGVLRLHVNFADDETAKEAAREQYLAAIESGLTMSKPKSQFYLEVNNKKIKDEDEVMKYCFTNKEDQARLQKSQGIANRNAQASEQKWEKVKKDLAAFETNPKRGQEEIKKQWKNSAAYEHNKAIKKEERGAAPAA